MNGKGEQGEKGERGPRGKQGPQRHYGPFYGYVISAVIFTILMYAMLLDHRSQEIRGCEERNKTRVELNERGKTIRTLLTIEIQEEEHHTKSLRARREATDENLPILDCEEDNPYPWPIDLFT